MTRRNKATRTSFSSEDPTTVTTLPASSVPTPNTLDDGLPLPKLIVFDLDYTLWPFWVDTHVSPPLKKNTGRDAGLTVKDSYGGSYGFYNDVAGILAAIKEKNIKIGVASRTSAPDLARQMLTQLRLPVSSDTPDGPTSPTAISIFDYVEMYPGSKTTHFEKIRKKSGVDYEEMLFFDDESRNRNVEQLGVVMQLVRDGVTRLAFDEGVKSWRKRNQREG